MASELIKTNFVFGRTTVAILQGDILAPGVRVDVLVSTDDNYLTMGSGVSRLLRKNVGPEHVDEYVRAAQAQCPVKAGSVVVTPAYDLKTRTGARYVLHGTVIDYDTGDVPLDELVEKTTFNCLVETEKRGLRSILFPAFATGAGRLSMERCARRMCSAIKSYLAQERSIERIYIILYLPRTRAGAADVDNDSGFARLNRAFIREANLVLGLPYNPAIHRRQIRDFYGREKDLRLLESVIVGEKDDASGKRHAVILGGPYIGKWSLLEQLYHRARQPDSPLSKGRHLVRLSFGRVHENTPLSFIYRKFLCALCDEAQERGLIDDALKAEFQSAYADSEMDCRKFLAFLDAHRELYPEIVFLVDKLPELLKMDAEVAAVPRSAGDFWRDLDKLQKRVRFIYTAREEDYRTLREARLEPFTHNFRDRIEEVPLRCVEAVEREEWINELFRRYLDIERGAPEAVHDFVEREAGWHPYLISLVGYALIERLKRELIDHPDQDLSRRGTSAWQSLFQDVLKDIEQPRNAFFRDLISSLRKSKSWGDDRQTLEDLVWAIAIEQRQDSLIPLLAYDPNALPSLRETQAQGDPRRTLQLDRLRWLGEQGILVGWHSRDSAQFMSQSFAAYVAKTVVARRGTEDHPDDVMISILSPKPGIVRTMFRGRGAQVVVADKPLPTALKEEFMRSFGDYIRGRFGAGRNASKAAFINTEELGNYILSQFTSTVVKGYLWNAPRRSTVLLMIDDALKDIPWELMLEAVYAGEIPFQVGRVIISKQAPQNIRPPMRDIRRIKALLIANPSNDPQLAEAESEVQNVAEALRRRPEYFDEPDVLIGEQCQRMRILGALSSGRYSLVHYSGHTRFKGSRSAWQVADGQEITTFMLTSAVQMAPPALVFSSSCESAVGGKAGPIRYEDQAFDLPGAFLQAGVEAYIGTLWPVEATAARLLTEEFYKLLLSGEYSLGECLRLAKWSRKQQEGATGEINWLSFILYGDPHLAPCDLFPIMRERQELIVSQA